MRKSVIIILLALLSVSVLQSQTFDFNYALVISKNFTNNSSKDYVGCNVEIKGTSQPERLTMFWSAPHEKTQHCIMWLDGDGNNYLMKNPSLEDIVFFEIEEMLNNLGTSIEMFDYYYELETKPGIDNRKSYYFITGLYAKNNYFLAIESETHDVSQRKILFRTKCLIPLSATEFEEMDSFFKEILPKVTIPK